MTSISLIVPCYNENENVAALAAALNQYSIENSNWLNLEAVFVDDASSDNSFELLRQQHYVFPVKIVRLARNGGSHVAFRAGLQYTSHDIVTQTSADLQHPLTLIKDMFLRMQETGRSFIIAQRGATEKIGVFEQAFSNAYTRLIRKYAIREYPNGGYDLFMIDGRIKSLMNANVENNSSILLQLLSFGFPFETVFYEKKKRNAGKSKWSVSKKIKLLVDSFVAFSYAPIRFVTLLGFTFFFVGVLFMIYVIFRKVTVGDALTGWPSLISILMLGFGITNISLGIIAEYLWRTLDASRKRPVFIIEKAVQVSEQAVGTESAN